MKFSEKRFFFHRIEMGIFQANSLLAETAIKQVAQYTKVVSHVFDSVSKAREEWEVESSTRSGKFVFILSWNFRM